MTVRMLTGDCRELLRTLPDASVHMVCTSPPYYGLRDYGTAQWQGGDPECDHVVGEIRTGLGIAKLSERYRGGGRKVSEPKPLTAKHECPKCGARRIDAQIGLEPTPDKYIATMVAVFREVRRVLRPDGTLWLNLGDSYATSPPGNKPNTTALSSGLPNSIENQEMRRSAQTAVNKTKIGAKPKDLLMMPARVALALQADGWFLRSQLPWIKRSCMPESTTDRPTNAIEYVFLLTKRPQYFWDAPAVARQGAIEVGVRAAKGSNVRSELKDVNGRPPEYWEYTGTRNFRNSDLFFDSLEPPHGLICDADGEPIALDVNTAAFPGAHFATFPPKLIEPLIKAGTSEYGCCAACGAPRVRAGWSASCSCGAGVAPCTVLDPFGGSGTVGLVCDRLGRDAILIDLNPGYAEMARNRIVGDAPLFAEVAAE